MRNRILVLATLVLFFLCGCSSLRRDPEDIRATLLKKTPLGTSHDEVWRYAERKEWNPQPYLKAHDTNQSSSSSSNLIVACLGGYSTSTHSHFLISQCRCVSMPAYVWALWGFDQHGLLDSIFVKKIVPWKQSPIGF